MHGSQEPLPGAAAMQPPVQAAEFPAQIQRYVRGRHQTHPRDTLRDVQVMLVCAHIVTALGPTPIREFARLVPYTRESIMTHTLHDGLHFNTQTES